MPNVTNSGFITRCIHETSSGLRLGLGEFSGTCRTAFIFKLRRNTPAFIYDPDNLLRDHELKLKQLYQDKGKSFLNPDRMAISHFSDILEDRTIRMDGLLAYGGRSGSVYYQVWLAEHQPEICSPLPIIMWLKYAFVRFSHDIANQEQLYTGISGHFLKEYGFQAVFHTLDYLLSTYQLTFLEFHLQEILEAVLGVSKTYEEGVLPNGRLVFVNPQRLRQMSFSARFAENEKPRMAHFKHVRKLLQAVENTDYRMICDGLSVHGYSMDTLFCPYITADYCGKTGFLYYNDMLVCSFTDGKFYSTTQQAKLVELEEILLDYEMEQDQRSDLFHHVRQIIHYAQKNNFGCSLLIDFSDFPLKVSSQKLAVPIKLEGNISLIGNLAKVDGALHIYKDISLQGFACLLDGESIQWEDRSRGARYNSALRFTSKHHDTVILVVSSDQRPVATIYQGMELNSRVSLPSSQHFQDKPIKLDEWFHTK